MNALDKQYTDLLQDILDNGVTKSDRTGTGTISIFGRQIRHDFRDGFPLLTTKRIPFKTIVTELLWFLRGDTNIKYLVDNGCHIWDGDAYKNWKSNGRDFWEEQVDGMFTSELGEEEVDKISKEWFINKIKTDDEFAKTWGELGPIYGKQWRSWKHMGPKSQQEMLDENTNWPWKTTEIDQIKNLINDIKTNPDSRRLMVNAWAVHDLPNMVLPPCHYGFQVYTRELGVWERIEISKNYGNKHNIQPNWDVEKGYLHHCCDKWDVPKRAISLMWNQRSVDTFLGLPFNIASYGLLLEIIAKIVNMVPDELIGNLGDTHLYSNHIEQAKEQIGREMVIEERVRWAYDRKLIDYVTMVESEELDRLNVPTHTRQPFPLPTLKHMKTESFYKSLSEDVSLVTHLDSTDFEIENYQSHPTIKAPLSN